MSDNRSSSGNISGFIRARERTHRHHNVQRSNVQRSTFQRSSLYLVSSAHEREHTVITTFNVPTFNVPTFIIISGFKRARERTHRHHNVQPSTFQRSSFISGFKRARERTHRHHNVQRSNVQPSTFNHPAPNVQPSTFNFQPSTFNLQPSTFNLQPSSPHTRSHTSRLIQRHTWRVSPPCAHHSSTA